MEKITDKKAFAGGLLAYISGVFSILTILAWAFGAFGQNFFGVEGMEGFIIIIVLPFMFGDWAALIVTAVLQFLGGGKLFEKAKGGLISKKFFIVSLVLKIIFMALGAFPSVLILDLKFGWIYAAIHFVQIALVIVATVFEWLKSSAPVVEE
jgi:hypothetical protein